MLLAAFQDFIFVRGARSWFLRAFSCRVTPDSRGPPLDDSLQNPHAVLWEGSRNVSLDSQAEHQDFVARGTSPARIGRIVRSNLGSTDFGFVGPKRARPLQRQA
jgi:hypothetical protein